jgi:hypothetical protein
MMSRFTAAFAAVCLVSYPAAGLAADSTLVLVMAGEAYDGPPRFSVSFGGEPLGEGAVAAAIDTVSKGSFAAASDKTSYLQSFTFTIPEARFKPDAAVAVSLTNEARGDDGSGHDRNLYLASVSINGRPVTASGITTETPSGATPDTMLGEFVAIKDGTVKAVAAAPRGGWPPPL